MLTCADYADFTDYVGSISCYSKKLPKNGNSPLVSVFRLTDRTIMKVPLASENCRNRTKCVGLFLCIVLFAFALLCAVSARGEGLNLTAAPDFYPQTLARQLQQIAESSAIETQPLRKIGADILNDLNNVVAHIERNPTKPSLELQRLEESIDVLETLRASWTITTSSNPDTWEYIPSSSALEEITLALKRRVFIWKSFLQAEAAEAIPITVLYERSFADINRLRERTLAVERHFVRSRRVVDRQTGQTWGDFLGTQSWLTELEAYQQPQTLPIRRVSLSTPFLPVDVLKTLSNRASATILRLESPHLTNEQRTFLNHPVVNAWKEELESWTVDTVPPISALRLMEQYEATGGMSDMRAFSHIIEQLSTSRTAEYRQFGNSLRRQYGMSNIRLFISSALLNNHLPPAVSEVASFREVIQSQPIVGRRQTETHLRVSLIPHPTRILVALNVEVDLATFSRSDASFATQLFNTGRTLVLARKAIELTEKGFLTEPSVAEIIDHRMRLTRMNTGFDNMPILSGMFRNAVLGQYESRFPEAAMEVRHKTLRDVRSRVDRDAEQRLRPINEQIRSFSQYADEEFGVRIERRESLTDENWLISSWGIRGPDSLMGNNTLAPETLLGAFADLKIHESLPNLMIGRFEFEGKRGTVGEFKEMLAEKLRQPALTEPGEHDDIEVTFASHNPMVVRFVDGRIELTISIAALRLFRQTNRDFQVIVRYKPAYDSEGRLVLERDGYISLINVREQILMRTVFGKIFPVSRPLPLVPKVLEDNPQFDYLTTGHCRIEKGWFALALVEKEE